MSKSKVLRLTLHKKAFQVMVTGEKAIEYREMSRWIESRLFEVNLLGNSIHRHYDLVEFTNGYGADKPRFTTKYLGVRRYGTVNETYSNGLHVNTGHVYGIILGEVVDVENYTIPII